jgi:DNA-binding response OmpR family regulator
MRRILIVDDEPLIAMMVEDWLSELGFEPVGPVGTVASALQITNEQSIDGAILDVSLGSGGDGYQVATFLQERNIPFAFATGRGAEDLDQRFKNAAVLTKPFEFETVKAVLASLFP